jgi:hypothetical protein
MTLNIICGSNFNDRKTNIPEYKSISTKSAKVYPVTIKPMINRAPIEEKYNH